MKAEPVSLDFSPAVPPLTRALVAELRQRLDDRFAVGVAVEDVDHIGIASMVIWARWRVPNDGFQDIPFKLLATAWPRVIKPCLRRHLKLAGDELRLRRAFSARQHAMDHNDYHCRPLETSRCRAFRVYRNYESFIELLDYSSCDHSQLVHVTDLMTRKEGPQPCLPTNRQ